MKLTSKLLKKMIAEEMQQKLPFPKKDANPEGEEELVKGITDFKRKLKDMAIQPSSNFQGLSPAELAQTISIFELMLKMGKRGTADTALKRIMDFMDQMQGSKRGEGPGDEG